jgi:hypothetical protein
MRNETERYQLEIREGLYVEPDQNCDDWDKADFRLSSGRLGIDLAVNVEQSGRKLRWPDGFGSNPAVRVKITFVGDGEEDQVTHGWAWPGSLDR